MDKNQPKYNIGTKVLANVEPHPGHDTEAFLPGIIEEQLGQMDIYDSRVPQEKVDFPVVQHLYRVRLDEGGEVYQFESRIILNPRIRQ